MESRDIYQVYICFVFFVVVFAVPYACDILITTSFTFIYRAQRRHLLSLSLYGIQTAQEEPVREISRLYSTLTTLPTSSRTLPPPAEKTDWKGAGGGGVRLHKSSLHSNPSSVQGAPKLYLGKGLCKLSYLSACITSYTKMNYCSSTKGDLQSNKHLLIYKTCHALFL